MGPMEQRDDVEKLRLQRHDRVLHDHVDVEGKRGHALKEAVGGCYVRRGLLRVLSQSVRESRSGSGL